MTTIAIIGAGNIGSRHLQGLARIAEKLQIYVIDPNPESLAIAKARFEDTGSDHTRHKVVFTETAKHIPPKLDLVISATNAQIRLRSLAALMETAQPKYLILEKIAFTSLREFAEADSLLKSNSVRTWVNCPKRTMKIYKFLKEKFRPESICEIEVSGAGWGLFCNAIHFLDCFDFLTGNVPSTVDTSQVGQELIESKRPGFYEGYGILSAVTSDTKQSIRLECAPPMTAPVILKIRSDDGFATINEDAGEIVWASQITGYKSQIQKFSSEFQSSMTGPLVEKILSQGTCELPTFERSRSIHAPLLEALGKHFIAVTKEATESIPIT